MSGQAVVELALATPVLLFLLLGVLAVGFLFLGAVQQASLSNTIAEWAGDHPNATSEERAAFESSVTTCSVTTNYGAELVRVSVSCPTIAGRIVPLLPTTITTTATGYVAPSPSPVP